MRECLRCKEAKPAEDFYANKIGRGGLSPYCKYCHSAAHQSKAVPGFPGVRVSTTGHVAARFEVRGIRYYHAFQSIKEAMDWIQDSKERLARGEEPIRYDAQPGLGEKRCGCCQQILPCSQFAPSGRAKDGLEKTCRECTGVPPGHYRCTLCMEVKPEEVFGLCAVGPHNRKGRDCWCKQCHNRRKRLYSIQVRSEERGLPCTLTEEQLIVILATPNCEICKTELTPETAQVDRIVPAAGYVLENCATLCSRCNVRKNDNTVESLEQILDFIRRRASLHSGCAE